MFNRYKLFDLIVESEVPIEETPCLNGDEAPDVIVKFGEISVADAAQHPRTFYFSDGISWYCVLSESHLIFSNIYAEYEVLDGNTITIRPHVNKDNELIRTFLLGSALGVLQEQRGRIPIHGGAICINGKAAIFSGNSGAGKSTITSSLVRRGYPFLSDDVSTISLKDGAPKVIPAYPQRKLRRDACIQLGYNPEKDLILIDGIRDKYAIRSDPMWQEERMPLGWIFEIALGMPGYPMMITPIDGVGSLGVFTRNIYRPWVSKELGFNPAKTKQIFAIAAASKSFRIRRPVDSQSVEEITDLAINAILNGI